MASDNELIELKQKTREIHLRTRIHKGCPLAPSRSFAVHSVEMQQKRTPFGFPREIDGVNYDLILLGGFGVSRGLNSIIEALDGPNQGKRYCYDLNGPLSKFRGVISNSDNMQDDR